MTALEELPGERGLPGVNDQKPGNSTKIIAFLGCVLILLAASFAAYFNYINNKKVQSSKETVKAIQAANQTSAREFLPVPTPPPVLLPVPTAAAPLSVVPAQRSLFNQKEEIDPVTQLKMDKNDSGLMVSKDINNQVASPPSNNRDGRFTDPQPPTSLGAMLSPTVTPSRDAEMLPDRNFLMTKGTFIDCALETKVDTTVPGMTRCIVTSDIYSDNGKILLIERGSKVSGEYQSNLKQGMARIFVLWSRITTPKGVAINLDSPGVDELGASGLPGYVDNHFMQRFGGAILISMISDFSEAATRRSSNNSQINFSNTSQGAQDMATEALKNTIDIPPTLYKNQGDSVGIYVARDLNFGKVYALSAE